MGKILYYIKKIIPKRLYKVLQPSYHYLFSFLSALFFCFPSEKLIVIGVTGTTGKTTSVYLIAKMLEANGYKVGFTSTAMFNNGEKEWLNDKKMTMIGRFFTQNILHKMVKNNCQIALVETTSEGVVQYRHRFINYDVLVFTGLYEEHIDAHGSFDNYKKAKGNLFKHLSRCKAKYVNDSNVVVKPKSGLGKTDNLKIKKTIVANGDDDNVEYFLGFWAEQKIIYTKDRAKRSLIKTADIKTIYYSDIDTDTGGTTFRVEDTTFALRILGGFNAVNAMTAVGVGVTLGLDLENIRKGLASVDGVAGRLEKIEEGQDFSVIVDYAFEPNAVAKLYETIERLEHNRIIHVLGSCGGGRDIARRPKLGQLAGERADIVIITNEDPYDDDPMTIIDQEAFGAEKAGKKMGQDLFTLLDRREAICRAFDLAIAKDIVIITGKGSEQAIAAAAGERIPWDDRAISRGLLKSLVEKKQK